MKASYTVHLRYMTPTGKATRWSGMVNVKPGEDIFATARRGRARKGARISRMISALAIPA